MTIRTAGILRRRGVPLVAALLAASAVAIGASANASASPTHKTKAHSASGAIYTGSGTVTFLVYEGAVARWLGVDTPNIRKDLKTLAPNVTLQVQDANGSAQTQLQQGQSVALQGTKGVIITPAQTDPQAIVDVMQKNKIPMIVLEGLFSGLKPGSVVGLVSPAPDAIGASETNYVLKHVAKGSEVALLNGDMAGQFAIVEHNGIESVLKSAAGKAKDLDIVADKSTQNWSVSVAEAEAAGVLTATHDKVKAFICGNDDVATGVVQALQKVGLQKKVLVVGMGSNLDGAKNIMQGTEATTTSWAIATEDELVSEIMAYKMAGKPVPKSIFDGTYNDGSGTFPFAIAPVSALGKSQMGSIIKNGGLTVPEVCKGLPKSVGAPC